ncbi:MAG: glycosyltransferase family 2 protein [Actinomycetota bacterium]|nr:glycosyltransferase family 2 protein [Actinomycetota bacterium]
MPVAQPRLTVGLPVYNGEAYLDETLRAIRAQSFEDFVLFVADNASTDGTREIVEAHQADDERITLDVATENRGASYNWNRCYAQAATPFFTWACADDNPLVDKYRVCIDLLDDAGPTAVLAYPGTDLIDEHGNITQHFDDMGPLTEPTPAGRLQRIVRDLELVNSLFGVIRTDVLKSTRGMEAYKRADTVLLGELAMRGQFLFEPEVHFYRRIHPEVSMQGSDSSIAAHYTGVDSDAPMFPNALLLRNHLAAIKLAPITATEKLQCVGVLRRWRYRKPFARELTRGAKATARQAASKLKRS